MILTIFQIVSTTQADSVGNVLKKIMEGDHFIVAVQKDRKRHIVNFHVMVSTNIILGCLLVFKLLLSLFDIGNINSHSLVVCYVITHADYC
jgi:hypothetical protein